MSQAGEKGGANLMVSTGETVSTSFILITEGHLKVTESGGAGHKTTHLLAPNQTGQEARRVGTQNLFGRTVCDVKQRISRFY